MNPVLKKDLLGLLRLRRIAAIQVLYVLTLAIVVMLNWPQGGVLSLADQSQDNLLMGLVLGQLVLLLLFVPGIASVSLTSEREQYTLEMLYASRLSAAQIISGKLLSAVSFPAILLVSSLPFLALLNWRGAVNIQQLMLASIILILASAMAAVISLAISAVCNQSATALVFTYVVTLVSCGATLVPAAIMLPSQGGIVAMLLHYVRALSPIAAAVSLLRPGFAEMGGREGLLLPIWVIFIPLSLLIMAICCVILIVVLRKPPVSPDAFGAPIGGDELSRSIGRRMMFLIDPKKKRKPFGSFNPLVGKESRTNSLRSGRWMIRIFYGALFISLGLAVMSLYGEIAHADLLGYVAQILVAFQIGVIGLVAPSLTSPAVSSEVENGTFETLRMTRLSGGQIFWGKFIPAFLPAVLPVIALLPAYIAICSVDPGYLARLLQLLPIVVGSVVFCCTLGLCCSSFVNNTARATVIAYLITVAFFVVPALAWWAASTTLNPYTAALLAVPSPIMIALNLLPGGSPLIQAHWSTHLWLMASICVLMLIVSRVRLTAMIRQG